MGRAPCCDKANVKRGPWSPDEDALLKNYIESHGTGGNWISFPHKAGLNRCGKSCRLRWLNYLRPDIKHGCFTEDEDTIICSLFNNIGSRWSVIASHLPGRTDNDIKNYWNTKLKKRAIPAQTSFTTNIHPIPSQIIYEPPNKDFHSDFRSHEPHRVVWDLTQEPPLGLIESAGINLNTSRYQVVSSIDESSAASSSTTMENSSSGSYANWSAHEAATYDWLMRELELPVEFTGGYTSQEGASCYPSFIPHS